MVFEKVYLEATKKYICLKNNTAHLYFILRRAVLHWNLSNLLRDASDIHRFPILLMLETHFLLENVRVPEPYLAIQYCKNSNIGQLILI